MQTSTPKVDELDPVERWRLEVLLEAGYPDRIAEDLAVAAHVDLHVAVELVTQHGCPPGTAGRILL